MAANVGAVRPSKRLQIAPIKNRAAQAVQASGEASAARIPAPAAESNPRNGSRIRSRGKSGFRDINTIKYNIIISSNRNFFFTCYHDRGRIAACPDRWGGSVPKAKLGPTKRRAPTSGRDVLPHVLGHRNTFKIRIRIPSLATRVLVSGRYSLARANNWSL